MRPISTRANSLRNVEAGLLPQKVNMKSRRLSFFVLGLLFAFYIPLGGQLYLGEIAVVAGLPLVVIAKATTSRSSPLSTWIVAAALFMSAGGMLAGYFAGDPISMIVAKLASGLSFAATILVLQLLNLSMREHTVLLLGFAIGWVFATFIQPTPDTLEAPWKFGLGVPVSILVIWALSRIPRPFAASLLISFAAVNLLLDFRSLTLICLATLIVGWTQFGSSLSRLRNRQPGPLRPIALIAACLAAGGVAAAAYGQLAGSGALGKAAQYRYQLQGSGDLLGMILGGRFEIFYSLPAALRNPILGYGATTPIPPDVSNEGTSRLVALGLQLVAERGSSRELIPTHSAIMSGWIYSGIFGLLLWLFIAGILLFVMSRVVGGARTPPVLIFITILGLWNVAYSPFGATTRILFAITISFAVCFIRTTAGNKGKVEGLGPRQ